MLITEDITVFNSNINKKDLYNSVIIGVDYGLKRCGIAISDKSIRLAFPLKIVTTEKIIDEIAGLYNDNNIIGIVFGWPKNREGGLHLMAKEIEKTAQYIAVNTSLPILLWDERMSTVGAKRNINNHLQQAVSTERKSRAPKEIIKNDDHYAASYVLQEVLNLINM
jgi:putative Holliday junction resolvase